MKWLILILGVITNAGASTLIKISTMPPRKLPSIFDPSTIAANWPFSLGLIAYGLTFLLYAMALSRFPLNIAHPVMTAGAIALVALLSTAILDEPLSASTAVGVFLIAAGVLLLAYQ